MATDSDDEVGPTRVPRRSAAPPPPAGGDSRPTTPSSPIAAVRAGRLPMSEPSERHLWPDSFIDRNGMVGSPSTPPEYYAPRATTPRAPTNRIALAAALESTRDRQPLLITDAHTVPLQDGTENARPRIGHKWSCCTTRSSHGCPATIRLVVGLADGQNAPVGLCVDAGGFLAKPRISVDVAVAAETASRPLATVEVG
ncbi:hypothetical protein MRX96_058147 [Rhipicephalus microplus]